MKYSVTCQLHYGALCPFRDETSRAPTIKLLIDSLPLPLELQCKVYLNIRLFRSWMSHFAYQAQQESLEMVCVLCVETE